ncbi:hypothetical protein ENBRE01_0128 [Enteropsectra breve]|nr:hypothetical protein ENBRE01_0128 [Enteropsectra breve]
MHDNDESNIEFSKILAKVMQSSYKNKEVAEIVDRIVAKTDRLVQSNYDSEKVKDLRKEFEEIRQSFYGLKK